MFASGLTCLCVDASGLMCLRVVTLVCVGVVSGLACFLLFVCVFSEGGGGDPQRAAVPIHQL